MPADALTRRDELLAELTSAHAAEHKAREFIRHVEAEIERTAAGRLAEYTKRARGHHEDGRALATLEHEWEDARSSLERANEKLDAARGAVVAVQNETAALLVEHLDVFAAEAEIQTQAAAVALAALAGPLARAHEAWQRAEQAWRPLAPAIAEVVANTDEEDGVWRDRGVAAAQGRVPGLPLPAPGFLAGLPAARPPGLRLGQEVTS